MANYRSMKKMRRVRYWRETIRNKAYAIAMLAIGFVPVIIDNDATFLIIAGFIAIPMFFAKENWID